MSLLKFGSISKYFSQPLLRGFTTACGFHVFTTQITHVLGIYVKGGKQEKIFNLIYVILRGITVFHSLNIIFK